MKAHDYCHNYKIIKSVLLPNTICCHSVDMEIIFASIEQFRLNNYGYLAYSLNVMVDS